MTFEIHLLLFVCRVIKTSGVSICNLMSGSAFQPTIENMSSYFHAVLLLLFIEETFSHGKNINLVQTISTSLLLLLLLLYNIYITPIL